MGETELIIPSDTYSDEIEEIRRTIDESRARIAQTLENLQDDVEERLDWKAWVQKNPRKAVGIAFALGFYIGLR
jgi:ElaB/YqjD/DUF883 family membrane-anchored ribosome-binding protein